MIYYLGLNLLIIGLSLLLIYQRCQRHRNRDIYRRELGPLRHWLDVYATTFLDVTNPPIDPDTHQQPPSGPYRDMLATHAYPSDIIAYAQTQLYANWPYKIQMAWDGWLFVRLPVLLPYIKDMVTDYQQQTIALPDKQLLSLNQTIGKDLTAFAQQTFNVTIDLHNTFTLKAATDHYEAEADQTND